MNDLISREAAVELLREKAREYTVSKFATSEHCRLARSVALDAATEIAAMPGVEPVRHGKWVYHDDDVMPWNSCSLCGCSAFDLHGANYCPNCGARMDEEVSGNGQAQD